MSVNAVRMTTENGRLVVEAPYHPALPAAAKDRGGKFDSASKTWSFDVRDEEAVRKMLLRIYGTDGAPTELRTIRVDAYKLASRGDQEIWVAGRRICSRLERDAGVRLGEGVVVVTGRFPASGGSRNHPAVDPREGTILEVRDVPRRAAEAAQERYPDAVTLIVDDKPASVPVLTPAEQALIDGIRALEPGRRELVVGLLTEAIRQAR